MFFLRLCTQFIVILGFIGAYAPREIILILLRPTSFPETLHFSFHFVSSVCLGFFSAVLLCSFSVIVFVQGLFSELLEPEVAGFTIRNFALSRVEEHCQVLLPVRTDENVPISSLEVQLSPACFVIIYSECC